MKRKVRICSEGGGPKGAGHPGAMSVLEERGFEVVQAVGTSAGAISSLMTCLNYRSADLREMMLETPGGKPLMAHFLHTPFPGLLTGGWRLLAPSQWGGKGGVFSASRLEAWLEEKVQAAGFPKHCTFEQLMERGGKDLTAIAFDWTEGRELDLNVRTAPRMRLSRAVRTSANLPFVWEPLVWDWKIDGSYRERPIHGHIVCDGGVAANLALDRLLGARREKSMGDEHADVPAIALLLDEKKDAPGNVERLCPKREFAKSAAMWGASFFAPVAAKGIRLVSGMANAHNLRMEEQWPEAICRIGVKGFGTLERLSRERAMILYESGRAAMEDFLATAFPAVKGEKSDPKARGTR